MTRVLALIGLCGLITAAGCSSGDSSGTAGGPGRDYSATIIRTTYGVPHITADNYGDLGFGDGYAYAQDNVCLLMREIVASNGQTARYFGEEDGDVAADYVYTFFNSDEMIEDELFQGVNDDMREALRGYAAGFNQYLADTGVDSLPEDCRGADWIRPISELDMGKVIRKLLLLASTSNFTDAIMAAEPPTQSMAQLLPQESTVFDLRNPLPAAATDMALARTAPRPASASNWVTPTFHGRAVFGSTCSTLRSRASSTSWGRPSPDFRSSSSASIRTWRGHTPCRPPDASRSTRSSSSRVTR
jgi:acyl-homoserine lactone acylase PvdQ